MILNKKGHTIASLETSMSMVDTGVVITYLGYISHYGDQPLSCYCDQQSSNGFGFSFPIPSNQNHYITFVGSTSNSQASAILFSSNIQHIKRLL